MEELVLRYFDAFYRLYGIISLKQAYRIIARQNPELNMTKEDFADIVSHIDTNKKLYLFLSEDEINYYLYDEPYDPSKNTDVFNKMLLNNYITTDDDAGADYYEELVSHQEGRAFYVPEKQELLKYEEDCHYEKNKYYYAMESFIRDELKLENYCEDIADEIAVSAIFYDSDIYRVIASIARLSDDRFTYFSDDDQEYKFVKLYEDLCNHTRREELRGHTPYEVGKCIYYKCSDEHNKNYLEDFFATLSKNSPCPCGSGKKFKRCCMGKGIYD